MLESLAQLDTVLLLLIGVIGVLGVLQGFIVGFLSLGGLVLGGVIASRVAPLLLEDSAQSQWTPFAALVGGLVLALVLSATLQDVGVAVRSRIRVREGLWIDRALGGLLSLVVGCGFVWILAAAMMAVPQLRELRPMIVESGVVRTLNEVMPPSGPLLRTLSRYDPFPVFRGPAIETALPDGAVPRDPQVRAASRSVVRVVGTACGFAITGSGWVATRQLVVTNAHVVAGQSNTRVQVRGRAGSLAARVVFFDADNDLALLQVRGLRRAPIAMRTQVPAGTAGAVLGYPESGPFDARPARYGSASRVRGEDIYGRGPVLRQVVGFRGLVRHGNSGGPLVDGGGRVLATVFAATVDSRVQGGYAVPNDLVRAAIARTHARVPTGPCVA